MIAGSCGQQGRIGQAGAEGDEELLLAAGPGEVVVAGAHARPGVGQRRLAVEVMDARRQPEADVAVASSRRTPGR